MGEAFVKELLGKWCRKNTSRSAFLLDAAMNFMAEHEGDVAER